MSRRLRIATCGPFVSGAFGAALVAVVLLGGCTTSVVPVTEKLGAVQTLQRPSDRDNGVVGAIFVSTIKNSTRGGFVSIFSQGSGHRLIATLEFTAEYSRPYGLATDSRGNLYVADAGLNVIDVYKKGGKSPSRLLPVPLVDPQFVAVSSAGEVAVTTPGSALIFPANSVTPCVTLAWDRSLEPLGNASFGPSGELFIDLPGTSGAIAKVVGGCKATGIALVPRRVISPADIKVDANANVYVLDALPSGTPVIDGFKPSHRLPFETVSLDAGAGNPVGFTFEGTSAVWVLESCVTSCLYDTVDKFGFPTGGKPIASFQITAQPGGNSVGIATSNMSWSQ